ncbi:MAG: hypothetical protein GXO47_05665 [Chlorobi bacterium]|nr:hypothetical protein [Chlorobiota bacterium]
MRIIGKKPVKYEKTGLFILLIFTFTSCIITYSDSFDVKSIEKRIDGVLYTFLSQIHYSHKDILGIRSRSVDVKIRFTGGDIDVKDKITLEDMRTKAGNKLPDKFVISDISFDKRRDKVLLYFYLKNRRISITVSFEIIHVGNRWVLVK